MASRRSGPRHRSRRSLTPDQQAAAREEAEARLERRRASVPGITYPEALPVAERREDILAALARHQVVIVAGETGSGKTTQLPKICLEAGRGLAGMIGHTQPRRIAARTVAERISEEMGVPLGGVVGYTVRFSDQVSRETLVKVMTDGILLAELQRDRTLSRYDTIIVDEAHERSLNIDFILGYLKSLLPRRPDLKVIVTSATIDTGRFSEHFDDAPIIQVSGRTFPVEIRYRPVQDEDTDAERDQVQAICDSVEELAAEGPGDLLVFLSGEREIRDTAEALRRVSLHDTEIVPLYARLSAAEQHKVFRPHRGRQVVLATNVAETSLTVPGIRYVIDPGTARISRYNRRTKVQRLPIESISRASANQRAGRCGRIGPGICVRLYGEDDFAGRPEFTDPEILRTNLASVILQMAAIGLGDVAAFPFLDPPDSRNIKDGVALLEELGALDPKATDPGRRLTAVGRQLAQLPVDPRLGRMVIEAERNGCFREVMVIAAALSIQDPRERPSDRQQAAAEAHARFRDPASDFMSYLNLWHYLQDRQVELSSSQFRKLCRSEFINYQRVREWQDICSQLRQVGRELGIRPSAEPAGPDVIHKSLLAGLLSHIGMRDPVRQDYLGARNAHFAIAPGSALSRKPPRWVMAAELVETSRLWARTVSRVQPEWAESLAPGLVKRSYSDPQWDPGRAAAWAHERVTLYGVPIVAARRVDYGRIDPVLAREMFIRHALVEGDWQSHHAFTARNEALMEQARALEERFRRRDLIVSEDVLFEFFDRRVESGVVSANTFDAWWKRARPSRPDRLDLSMEILIEPSAGTVDPLSYPDIWRQDGLELKLTYELDATADTDGVSVHIPLPLLGQVADEGFDWQVPGLREELVTALIRALPKSLRRNFLPAADFARAFLERADPSDGPLVPVLARELGRMTGVGVPNGGWNLEQLPSHLRMTFLVEDTVGRPVAVGKDLGALRAQVGRRARQAVASAIGRHEQEGLTAWTVGALSRVVEESWEGQTVRGHPALVDEGDSVALRIFGTEGDQVQAMWAGTRRLLLLNAPGVTKALRSLSNQARLAISHSPYARVADLLEDAALCAVDLLLDERGGPVWDAESYAALEASVRTQIPRAVLAVVKQVGALLNEWRVLQARLDRTTSAASQPAVADMRRQLDGLVHEGFLSDIGSLRLAELPRYLAAVHRRLDKAPESWAKDAERMVRVQRLQQELEVACRARAVSAEAAEVSWMLEELRVSLFAQVLGTPQSVSEERIRRAIAGLSG